MDSITKLKYIVASDGSLGSNLDKVLINELGVVLRIVDLRW